MRVISAFLIIIASLSFIASASAQISEIDKLFDEIDELTEAKKYSEAIPLAQKLLKLSQEKYGPDHQDVGLSLGTLADLYRQEKRYSDAEPIFLRAIENLEKSSGPDDLELGDVLFNLGALYQDLGRYSQTEHQYKRGLKIYETALAPGDRDLGFAMNRLGSFYFNQGRYAEAERHFKRALAGIEKSKEKNAQDKGLYLSNLASLYNVQGRVAEAEALDKRTLALIEKELEADHPLLGVSLNKLGQRYYYREDYDKAEQLFRRALKIFINEYGPEEPIVGNCVNNLGHTLQQQGKVDEAERNLKRALAIFEMKLGKNHSQVAVGLSNVAGLMVDQNRLAEAEPLLKRSLSIIEKHEDPNHPQLPSRLHNLASLYFKQGRYEEAKPLREKALTLWEKSLGPDHILVRLAVEKLVELNDKLGHQSEAAKLRVRLAEMPDKGTRHLSLFFATNRDKSEDTGFGTNRTDTLNLGTVVMKVPEEQVKQRAARIGENLGLLEQARSGELTGASTLKLVRTRHSKNAQEYASTVRSSQARAAIFKNQAIVFVHGYNNSFEGAVQRATQLSFDLQFDGIMMPFAWPSQGSLTGYLTDLSNARQSVDTLVSFLDELRDTLPEVKIHMLGHSLGNRVMLYALCKIAKRKDGKKHNFGQIISAHADVSHAEFEEKTSCFRSRVEGTTLYVNEGDTALRVRCAGFRCRAGNKARGYSAADVVDTTAMSKGTFRSLSSGFDHDIFVRNPLLFSDIARLLLTGERPVDTRTQEFRPQTDGEKRRYWAYDEAYDPASEHQQITANE